MAVLKSAEAGDIILTAKSDLLTTASLTVKARKL